MEAVSSFSSPLMQQACSPAASVLLTRTDRPRDAGDFETISGVMHNVVWAVAHLHWELGHNYTTMRLEEDVPEEALCLWSSIYTAAEA